MPPIAYGHRRITVALTALVFALLLTLMAPEVARGNPAPATPDPGGTVRSIQTHVISLDHQFDSTLTLNFEKPIAKIQAAGYLQRISTVEPAVKIMLGPAYLSCGGSGKWSDSNGTLSLQYSCSSTDYLAWGYTISPAVKAIIVSSVTEQGLSWWRNGVSMPRNAPHVVPKDYLLHGTMSGATTNSTIQYQDYLTFRHNLGGGGTGSITWAGQVHTLSD
jgi:hypothetical protein